jgi:hypothetical protein
MNDLPPPFRVISDDRSTEKGKPHAGEASFESDGYWWLATILPPILGIVFGILKFLYVNRNNSLEGMAGFAWFGAAVLVMLGFLGGSLLSFVFMVISIIKKEKHAGRAVIFSIILLLLNIMLFFPLFG